MAPTDVDTIPVEGDVHVLLQAFIMIIFSEIGDKTFLIAAILAMRHPRIVVFAGAITSLALMSTLSAAMGHVLPSLIPKQWTQLAAAVLFLVFGTKMVLEAKNMKGGNEKIKEEMKEAEEEIENDEAVEVEVDEPPNENDSIPMKDIEAGSPQPTGVRSRTATETRSWRDGARNFCNLFLGPVFVQAFVLTFLGEWGDRSQIATIALGAAHNVYIVTFGTIVGHTTCTALAVIGGRYISTKISVKHVTFGGAVLFLIFGIVYFYEAFAASSDMEHTLPIMPES